MYSMILLLAASTGGEAASCPPGLVPCPPVIYHYTPVIRPVVVQPVVVRPVVVQPVVVQPVVVQPVVVQPTVVRPQINLDIDLVEGVLDLLGGRPDPVVIQQKTRLDIDIKAKARLKLSTGGASQPQEEENEGEVPAPGVKASGGASCTVVVQVPARARLYVNGKLTKSTSARRTFVTPLLSPGHPCNYDLKVEFERGDETVCIKRVIKVSAGATVRLNLEDADDDE